MSRGLVTRVLLTFPAPMTQPDSYGLFDDVLDMSAEGKPKVLANDIDMNGDPMTAQWVSGPSHGSLTLRKERGQDSLFSAGGLVTVCEWQEEDEFVRLAKSSMCSIERWLSSRSFEKPDNYNAFMRVLDETWQLVPLPIYAMVVMPNHWHFVVRPTADDQVSEFFRRLTVMHTMLWHAHYKTGGTGHLHQGQFKSFPGGRKRVGKKGPERGQGKRR